MPTPPASLAHNVFPSASSFRRKTSLRFVAESVHRHAHGRTRVAGVGLLDSVHGQRADGIGEFSSGRSGQDLEAP